MSDDKTTPVDPPSGSTVSGTVRIDERARKLAARLEPGEIAVIDLPDIDRATANALIAARPRAVLNASLSTTGRIPNLGPGMILAAGIILVDDLGSDVMVLREGDKVSIDGSDIMRDGKRIATGRPRSPEDDAQAVAEARRGVSAQVEAFAISTGEFLERESKLLIDGEGIPTLKTPMKGRPVVIVMPSEETRDQLKRMKKWIRDTDPVFIAVDEGAEAMLQERRRPDIVVGDMDLVPDKILNGKVELVVISGQDGAAPGRARLDTKSLSYEVFTVSGSSEDAAILLADIAGASSIVTVGGHFTLDDFLDSSRAGMAASFFTRLRAGDKIIGVDAVAHTYRPRISIVWLVVLLLAMLAAFGAAVYLTPWGQGAWDIIIHHIGTLIGFGPDSGSAG